MAEILTLHDQRLSVEHFSTLHASGDEFTFDDGAVARPLRTVRTFGEPRTERTDALHSLGMGVLSGPAKEFARKSIELFTTYQALVVGKGDTWLDVYRDRSPYADRFAMYGGVRMEMDRHVKTLNQALTVLEDEELYVAAALVPGSQDRFATIKPSRHPELGFIAARLARFTVTDENGEAPIHIEPVVISSRGNHVGFLPEGSQLLTRPLYTRVD